MPDRAARPRRIEIVAQDPSVVTKDGRVVTAVVTLPGEDLDDGPMGCSVYIMDYDASTGQMYRPVTPRGCTDIALPATRSALLADPGYQAWNAYAIVIRTLQRFEFALGRRVGWGIRGHQLKVVPHAFEESNAFYSPEAEALLFGYVRGRGEGAEPTMLCLSHDVIVHETAHALLDGLRAKFMSPSSPDQAALHEAFADIVALLSVFSQPEVVRHLLCPIARGSRDAHPGLVKRSELSWERLKNSALLGLADNMRGGTGVRANALRRSVEIAPDTRILSRPEYLEEHRRGEVFVGAVMRSFLTAWVERIERLGRGPEDSVDVGVVAEAGADIADLLLTMSIRAIDYTPPVHILFGDFLSAMLTADYEVRADDSRYRLRENLLTVMAQYGITPASSADTGCWCSPDLKLVKNGTHFSSLQTDTTEMFRHVWNNKAALRLNPHAYTRITSVRPCLRVSPQDGFQVRETVVECGQYLKLTVPELISYGLRPPKGMPADTKIELEGGSTLILDEYGELKFEVSNSLPSPPAVDDKPQRRRVLLRRWQRRLDYLWDGGYLTSDTNRSASLASLHRLRTEAGVLSSDQQLAFEQRKNAESWS